MNRYPAFASTRATCTRCLAVTIALSCLASVAQPQSASIRLPIVDKTTLGGLLEEIFGSTRSSCNGTGQPFAAAASWVSRLFGGKPRELSAVPQALVDLVGAFAPTATAKTLSTVNSVARGFSIVVVDPTLNPLSVDVATPPMLLDPLELAAERWMPESDATYEIFSGNCTTALEAAAETEASLSAVAKGSLRASRGSASDRTVMVALGLFGSPYAALYADNSPSNALFARLTFLNWYRKNPAISSGARIATAFRGAAVSKVSTSKLTQSVRSQVELGSRIPFLSFSSTVRADIATSTTVRGQELFLISVPSNGEAVVTSMPLPLRDDLIRDASDRMVFASISPDNRLRIGQPFLIQLEARGVPDSFCNSSAPNLGWQASLGPSASAPSGTLSLASVHVDTPAASKSSLDAVCKFVLTFLPNNSNFRASALDQTSVTYSLAVQLTYKGGQALPDLLKPAAIIIPVSSVVGPVVSSMNLRLHPTIDSQPPAYRFTWKDISLVVAPVEVQLSTNRAGWLSTRSLRAICASPGERDSIPLGLDGLVYDAVSQTAKFNLASSFLITDGLVPDPTLPPLTCSIRGAVNISVNGSNGAIVEIVRDIPPTQVFMPSWRSRLPVATSNLPQ
jgi:hypothetical protein